MKRRHVLALVASAALVLPAGGIWLWARHAENVLAAAQQRCRDEGLPMTIDDLRPPPVPDEDNAALVLAKLEPMLKALDRTTDESPTLFDRLSELEIDSDRVAPSAEVLLEVERLLSEPTVQEASEVLSEMTGKIGFVRSPTHRGSSEGDALSGTSRHLLSLIRWQIRLAAARGDSRAVDSALVQLFRVGEMLKHEPATITQMFRSIFLRATLEDLERVNGAALLSVQASRAWERRLEGIDLKSSSLAVIDHMRLEVSPSTFGESYLDVPDWTGWRRNSLRDWRRLAKYRLFPGSISLENAAFIQEIGHIRMLVAQGSQSFAEFSAAVGILRAGGEAAEWIRDLSQKFLKRNYWGAETRLSAARIGLALDRYRAAHGVYPAALAELAPAFLPEVPQDFFSGKAFVYVRDADGLGALVYSVGPNMRDDGGVKDDPSSASGSTGTSDRDDESWACGAAAKRKFATPAPAP